MAYVFVTERFIFKCKEEVSGFSCLKFSINGEFFRVINISKIGEKYFIIDDSKKEIRSNLNLLDVTKKYIAETYGEIRNVFERN